MSYKPFFLFLLLGLLLSGCYKVNKVTVKKPADLIPKEKMVDLVTQMQIIEGIVVYHRTRHPDYQNLRKAYYKVLFDRFHVTKEQVKASLDYYNSRGDEMAAIYGEVQKRLSAMQEELNLEKQREEEKKHPARYSERRFPFPYKEDYFSKYCYNPVP